MTSGPAAPHRPASSAALALSCHPLPTVAVTAISAGLAALAGLSLGRGALLVAAVFAGQLSIGWSNDAIDAARDRASDALGQTRCQRRGLAPGGRHRGRSGAACVAIVLSLALGWLPGLASLTVVACGWLYNLGLEGHRRSPSCRTRSPSASLPAVATLALPEPVWPAPWAMVAGALFGVSAHLANVLPDLDDDIDTGVRGLPHRIGARATAVACPVLLGAASLVILFGTAGPADRAVALGRRRPRWSC